MIFILLAFSKGKVKVKLAFGKGKVKRKSKETCLW